MAKKLRPEDIHSDVQQAYGYTVGDIVYHIEWGPCKLLAIRIDGDDVSVHRMPHDEPWGAKFKDISKKPRNNIAYRRALVLQHAIHEEQSRN